MDSLHLHRKRFRRSYNKIEKILDYPNLIDIQKSSYESFLQLNAPHEERQPIGMEGVFKSVFPIKDFNETCSLEYVRYMPGKPKYDVDECTQRGMTYSIPIKITVQNGEGIPQANGLITPAWWGDKEAKPETELAVLLDRRTARKIALAVLAHLSAWAAATYYQRVTENTWQPTHEVVVDPGTGEILE